MFTLAPYLGHETFLDQRRGVFATVGYLLRNVFGNNTHTDNIALTGANSVGVDVSGQILTLAGIISGTGAMTKVGPGTIALNGDNTFSGGTSINTGGVISGHNNAFGTGVISIASGACAFSSTVDGLVIANNITIGPNVLTIGGDKAITFSGTFSFYSNPAPAINLLNSALTTFTGPLVLSTTNGNTNTILSGTGNVTISGNMSDGFRSMGFRWSSTGLLILSGTNSYTGETRTTAGTLRLVGAASLSSGTSGLTFSGTAPILQLYGDTGQTFDVSKLISFTNTTSATTIDLLGAGSNQTHTIGNISASPQSIASSLIITGSNGYGLTMGNLTFIGGNSTTRTLTNNAEGLWNIGAISDDAGVFNITLAFSGAGAIRVTGAISDSTPGAGLMHVTKGGTNTLTLEGTNTYDGTTAINGGTLQGTGSIASNTTVANTAGCTIRGGTGAGNAGTFTITGTLTFAGANARLAVGIGSTSTCSLVAVSGAVALGGMTVNFDTGYDLDPGTYTLITGGSMSGTVVAGIAPTGRSWTSLGIVGNNLVAVLA